MKDISLIIPVFNEEAMLAKAVETIIGELNKINDLDSYELIIVDDGSQDSTWNILSEQLCPIFPQIHAIQLSRNFGKESALCAGLEQADARAIIVMDADLQHPPQLIQKMFSIWQEGSYDVVEAVKRSRGKESLVSRLAANSFYSLISVMSDIDLRNASDFKLMDKCVVDAWKELPERSLFFRGMSAWVGFKRKQILFDVVERADSDTKWSAIKLVSLALTSIAAYSSAPLHLITLAGIIFLAFSFIMGAITLYHYFTGVAVSGFSTVILLLLIIGGGIMIALGIIGEYIARIFDEVKRRPRFLISDRISGSSIKPRNRS